MGKIRRWRGMLVGLVAGLVLMAGGQALADHTQIPDSHPSSPDSTHTLFLCVSKAGTGSNGQYKPVYVLDKTLGNCTTSQIEVRVVPSALP
jgi:hypothetical protein